MAGLKGCATAAVWAASAAPVGRSTRATLIWPHFCMGPSTGGAGSLATRPELLSGSGCPQLCCYAYVSGRCAGAARCTGGCGLGRRACRQPGAETRNGVSFPVPMLTCACVRRRCAARNHGGERAGGGQHAGQPGCGAAGAADWAALRGNAAAIHGGVGRMQPRSGSGAASAVRAGDLHCNRLAEDLRSLLPGAYSMLVLSLLAHALSGATDGGLVCCHPW